MNVLILCLTLLFYNWVSFFCKEVGNCVEQIFTGLQILDTCGSVLIAQKQLFNLITSTRDPIGSVPELPTLGPPILGK